MSGFRRALIGGNWKCNGTVAEVTQLIDLLNAVDVPASSEVKLCLRSH
jgi:triosephosphate isomerase